MCTRPRGQGLGGLPEFTISLSFVIFGVMRYLQITFVEKNSGSPTEIIFKDKTMQINLLLWFLSFIGIIYFKQIFL